MIQKNWTQEAVHQVLQNQRDFFASGKTLDVSWRISQLKALREAIRSHEAQILRALNEDLGRHPAEAYFCDIGSIILEINETIKGLRKWARPETHYSGMLCFPSTLTKVYKMPYGVTLIISP